MTNESTRRQKVLFVCTGNTCRSVFAEYLGRQVFGDAVEFESAGIRPQRAADAESASQDTQPLSDRCRQCTGADIRVTVAEHVQS
jgi:protein-tyrosine-phosphatase